MRMRTFAVALAVIVHATWSGSSLIGQTADPQVGTWKMNVAKSTYENLPPESLTTTIEPSEAGYKITVDEVNSRGQRIHTEVTAKFDGKEYVRRGSQSPRTTAFTRIDDRTYDFIERVQDESNRLKINVASARSVISPDGKTRTVTVRGVNSRGQTVNNVQVYEKQ
jgi:hypothetical protein